MRLLRTSRWILLALLLSLVPASSYAGVFISVGFAPPVLPVYVQPPCPQPGLIWTPGYWAYGEDGYFWVPGQWVPAPYEGALWTPPYWGWDGGLYVFHPGYWAEHVGYYGGVNYGFGYFGVGFLGGEWRGRDFYYNRAVWRVDEHRIHDYYEDRRDWDSYRVGRDRHVSYSGGPGGIRHEPNEMERRYMRDQHMERTSFQERNQREAMGNRNAYARFNGGRPANVVAERPAAGNFRQGWQNGNVNRAGTGNNQAMQPRNDGWQRGNQNMQRGNQNRQSPQAQSYRQQPQYQQRNNQDMQRGNQNWQQRPTPQSFRQQPQFQQNENPRYQNRQMQPNRIEPQYQQRGNQNWQQRPTPQSYRQQPQVQQRANPRFQNRPEPQPRQQPQQNRQEPAPREQGRPGPHGR